jgi:cell division protein FtsW (lipid II flippase)
MRGSVALLIYPVLLLAVGLVLLALERRQVVEWQTLTGAGLFAAGLVATAVWVRWRLPNADPFVLPLAAALASLGQLMTSRLEPSLGPRQGLWVLAGLASLAGVTLLPSPARLRRYRYTWATLGVLLLVLTLIFGSDPNGSGARLWIVLGPLNFQPMELVKLLLVMFLAAYLEEYRELLALAGRRLGPLWLPPMPYLAPMLLMVGMVLAVLFWQRDLGPALLLFSVMLAMLYAASGRLSYVGIGLVLLVLAGALADRMFEHVRVRVENWIDPWSQAAGTGYQLVQGLYALASGGVIGAGLDAGSPRYIPAVHTDFVIAAIGEELGLVGSLAVINLFVVLTLLGLRIAVRARSGFNALLALGVTAVLALQALIILAGTLKLIPMTGITLPFVSYGGSSVLANFLLVGFLLSVSNEENSFPSPSGRSSSGRATGASLSRRFAGQG